MSRSSWREEIVAGPVSSRSGLLVRWNLERGTVPILTNENDIKHL
ncbi:MAG: hypothetical protein ACJ8R9_27185 [Steroidobacteraceae bacterium]